MLKESFFFDADATAAADDVGFLLTALGSVLDMRPSWCIRSVLTRIFVGSGGFGLALVGIVFGTFGIRKIVEPSRAVVVGPGRAAADELEVAEDGLSLVSSSGRCRKSGAGGTERSGLVLSLSSASDLLWRSS